MARNSTYLNESFSKNLFTHSVQKLPTYSSAHPLYPLKTVPEWKTDMKNRNLILQNADLGSVPHYEHDDALFLNNREQLTYNAEDSTRVDNKGQFPTRRQQLQPNFHHESSRFLSSFISRTVAAPKQFGESCSKYN